MATQQQQQQGDHYPLESDPHPDEKTAEEASSSKDAIRVSKVKLFIILVVLIILIIIIIVLAAFLGAKGHDGRKHRGKGLLTCELFFI